MNRELIIKLVTDPAEVSRAMALIEPVVEKPWHLRMDWLTTHKWVAVPVESASHFEERDAELLANAAVSIGCEECSAVATEPLLPEELCYTVPTTKKGFLDFSRQCFSLNYVLISEDRSFAVLCTSEDYYIVAGPRDFVIKAVGSSIETARKMFLSFADDRTWPPSERRRLVGVAERYADCQ